MKKYIIPVILLILKIGALVAMSGGACVCAYHLCSH